MVLAFSSRRKSSCSVVRPLTASRTECLIQFIIETKRQILGEYPSRTPRIFMLLSPEIVVARINEGANEAPPTRATVDFRKLLLSIPAVTGFEFMRGNTCDQ